jgi:hypothetical protein
MKLDYIRTGKVKIPMEGHVDGMLGEIPENMAGIATTPAGNHLFTVNPWGNKT